MTSDPFYEIRDSPEVLFSSEALSECLAFARSYLLADRDRTLKYVFLCDPTDSTDFIAGTVQQVFDPDDGSQVIMFREYGASIDHEVREDGSLGKPILVSKKG